MRFDPAFISMGSGVHGVTVGAGDSRMGACLLALLNSARFISPLYQEPLLELLLGNTLSEMVLPE